MPIYEYRCADCNETTEVIQGPGEGAPTACPNCGGQLKKLLSAPAFQFKGSGWYVTDYARKQAPAADKSAKSNGEKTAASSDAGESPGDKTKDTKKAATTSDSKSTGEG